SAQDLEQEIAQVLLDNPLLERVEEYDTEGAETETESLQDEGAVAELSPRTRGGDDDSERPVSSAAPTLRQYLLEQLHLTRATARDRVLVELLIEELDDNGYLTTPLEELAALLPPE